MANLTKSLVFPIKNILAVDKMCKTLWVSRWIWCGKNFRFLWKRKFYTKNVGNLQVLHVSVEKFYLWFYTEFYRGKWRVLHIFHRPYYYYY